MIATVQAYCDRLPGEFDSISAERKLILEKIAAYIQSKKNENKPIRLVYICTHNSRRSHFGQIWAQVAAHYYKIKNVTTFSGGTEATAFHPHAIQALLNIGFEIEAQTPPPNPVYYVYYDRGEAPVICFSKVYHHPENPQKDFAAIMTCGDAEENCPFIPGAELRIATTYQDPKTFDHTPQQNEKYDERCRQIALEIFYVFSKVK